MGTVHAKVFHLELLKGQQRGETSEQRLRARVFLVLPVRGDLQMDDGRQREQFAERAGDPGPGFPASRSERPARC